MAFDLKQLAVFIEVVRCASFSGAARSLNLAQASVSERILTLEESVGTRLLDRLGRKVIPTSAGELLLRRGRELLELQNETERELRELLGLSKGEVSLGASTTPGEYILPGVIQRFKRRHPAIGVRMLIGDSLSITRRVEDGTQEFGVVGFREESEQLKFQALADDDIVLVVAGNHPLTARRGPVSPEQLEDQPIVLRESGSGTRANAMRPLTAIFKKSGVGWKNVTELGSSTAVKEGVKAGLGFALLSRRAIRAELASSSLKIVEMKGLPIKRKFYLVTDKRRTLSPAARAFSRFLLDNRKHLD